MAIGPLAGMASLIAFGLLVGTVLILGIAPVLHTLVLPGAEPQARRAGVASGRAQLVSPPL